MAEQALETERGRRGSFPGGDPGTNLIPAKTVNDALAGADRGDRREHEDPTISSRSKAEHGCVASYTHRRRPDRRPGGSVETDVVNDAVKEALAKTSRCRSRHCKAASMSPTAPTYQRRLQGTRGGDPPWHRSMNDPEECPASPRRSSRARSRAASTRSSKRVCLLEQVYVKAEDGKQTVGQYVEQPSRRRTARSSPSRGFVRFETGEGLEKKNEDFAAEVAAQMGM